MSLSTRVEMIQQFRWDYLLNWWKMQLNTCIFIYLFFFLEKVVYLGYDQGFSFLSYVPVSSWLTVSCWKHNTSIIRLRESQVKFMPKTNCLVIIAKRAHFFSFPLRRVFKKDEIVQCTTSKNKSCAKFIS